MLNILSVFAKEIPYKTFEGIGGIAQPSANPIGALENVISKVIGFLSVVGVVYFTIQIVLAGYSWISAGGETQKVKQAQDKLWQSFLGLAIMFLATVLVSLMGYLLGGVDLLNIQKFLGDLAK